MHGLWSAIGRVLELHTPAACANYLAHRNYDAN